MYIFGGDIYVNAGADGLDSNGNIVISGGNIEILVAKSGSDGDPMDREGKLSISDATVLAGGNQGMTPVHQSLTIKLQYFYTTQSYSSIRQYLLRMEKLLLEKFIFQKISDIYFILQ